jgi:Flp pilus assembly protein TadG
MTVLANLMQSSSIARLWRDRRGSYSVMTALLLPAVVGFTGFGTEVGLWYYAHQSMQGTADSAAISAAVARVAGNTAGTTNEARTVASQHGFRHGTDNVTVQVNSPPTSGPNMANASAVEVIISQPQQRLFSAALQSTPLNISARAVAATVADGVACILGLDPTAANTVQLLNNAVLPNPNCGVASNSSAATALALSNNSHIYASTTSHGGTQVGMNAALHGSPNLTNASAIPDPYATRDAGTPPACTSQNGVGINNGSRTLRPDVTVGGVGMARFCTGWNFQNNFSVTLEPGIYFIDQQLVIGNNAVVTGSNVTLVIGGNFAINMNNNAIVTLTAPTQGPTAGLVFFGSRTGTATIQQRLYNNSVLNLTGAIYFPNQIINLENNTSTDPNSGCSQVIGRRVIISNNVTLQPNCTSAGTTAMNMGATAALVE